MCGRYHLSTPIPALVERFAIQQIELSEFGPRYNISPTTTVPIVRLREGQRALSGAHWGLVPFWAKDQKTGFSMINARAETVAEKRSFKGPLAKSRCLIPADGWFEWCEESGGKQPYHYQIAGGTAAFAGLWTWHSALELLSCTIIVTSANDLAGRVHDRMPVILAQDCWSEYLAPETPLADVQALLKPYEGGDLTATRVSKAVNSVRNQGPQCIEPA